MKILLIGDLHLSNWYPGYLDSQVDYILKTVKEEKPHKIVFLGDILHNRKPSTVTLLAFRHVLEELEKKKIAVTIVVGNHDFHSKADDGVTSLQLIEDKCQLANKPIMEDKLYFIPHYENEEIISELLAGAPEDKILFGHFSYKELINARNVYDFNLSWTEFKNPTFLGHVHSYKKKKHVTVLGTPYTTQFSESGKNNFIGVIYLDKLGRWKFRKKLSVGGPRHLIMPYDKVEEFRPFIDDPDYYTLMRVVLDLTKESNADRIREEVLETNARYAEVRFNPVLPRDMNMSNWKPDTSLFKLNEAIIDEYLENNRSSIPLEDLKRGLELLK